MPMRVLARCILQVLATTIVATICFAPAHALTSTVYPTSKMLAQTVPVKIRATTQATPFSRRELIVAANNGDEAEEKNLALLVLTGVRSGNR